MAQQTLKMLKTVFAPVQGVFVVVLFLSVLVVITHSWTQAAVNVAARLGYPELVLYNAKIVTMDDPSFRSTVGTVAEAMAVRDFLEIPVEEIPDIVSRPK